MNKRTKATNRKNSRRKGADGERELAALLREYGYDARRGQQYSGCNGDADVVGLPGVHIECKRVEHLNLDAAMDQSVSDAAARGEIPTVFHRRNGKLWKVTLLLDDFVSLLRDSRCLMTLGMHHTKYMYQDDELEQMTVDYVSWETVSISPPIGVICVHADHGSIDVIVGSDPFGSFVAIPEYSLVYKSDCLSDTEISIAAMYKSLGVMTAAAVAYVIRDYITGMSV